MHRKAEKRSRKHDFGQPFGNLLNDWVGKIYAYDAATRTDR